MLATHLHQYPEPFDVASVAAKSPPAYVLEAAAPSKAITASPEAQPPPTSNAEARYASTDIMARQCGAGTGLKQDG